MAKTTNPQEDVEIKKPSVEELLKKYQKVIYAVIIAAAVIVLAIFAVNKLIVGPRHTEASAQMFPAEEAFMSGDYATALNGDGNNFGFASIIENYKGAAGKIVYFYAGVCELQLGNNESAISYFNKYNGKDKILKARALCCTGDALVNIGKLDEAIGYFTKAAKVSDNELSATYLMKAAAVCEKLGKNADALKYYEQIKKDYPNTMEGYDVDKYITRIQNK